MIRSLITKYNAAEYDFGGLVKDSLDVDSLLYLHQEMEYKRFRLGNDQNTQWHKDFYDYVTDPHNDNWYYSYYEFVRLLARMFGEELIFQRVPTFRVHLPGNVAVAEPHTDGEYGHDTNEINIWVPLTDAYDTSAVWLWDSKRYRPLNASYGDIVIFDGANVKHYNKENETGVTRVSFDFRVIPKSLYHDSQETAFNTGLPFRLPKHKGELTYWSEF